MYATNRTDIRPASISDSLAISLNREQNDWEHLQSNLNLTHNFENGATLNADFDYLVYDNQNPITYDLSFEDKTGNILSNQNLLSEKDTPFNILVGKVDYSVPISKKAKWPVRATPRTACRPRSP